MEEYLKLCFSFFAGTVASYIVFTFVLPQIGKKKKKTPNGCCNTSIKKHQPKVVDTVDVEDLPEKVAFCRCWKSSTFPKCDGSHNKHNKETGDNVGPLLINKKCL